ncbi:ATP-binding protein [Streptomyces sp. NRRL S-474]|uniref:ATP-binding protein n=1 Tax=Streptomyces sp. NRRL S-474 TaxID=1463909 RepID=UPI002D21C888|nr:ATP-binding protein [Streptomyces sp. NRRL S-474]
MNQARPYAAVDDETHQSCRHHPTHHPLHFLEDASAARPRLRDALHLHTPRSRLARRLAAVRLDAWGIPYGSDAHDAIVLIVAELTANAVSHGHVPGRDFHLRLHATPDGRTVRVEVTGTRTERNPRPALPESAAGAEETGRGPLLVSQLAARWDWHPRPSGPGKTVWAEYEQVRAAQRERNSHDGGAREQVPLDAESDRLIGETRGQIN